MPGRLCDERIASLPVDVAALEDYALERALDEPLFRLLYVLSTGIVTAPSRQDEGSYERSNVIGVQAAMDLLNTVFVKQKQVQPTQLLVGRLLQDGNAKQGDL
jgi:hypothetical protein